MKLNYTIDAPSPILQYIGSGWTPISQSSDNEWSSYNNHTAIATPNNGDEVTLNFYGTGVWLYGARRGNHGPYSVTLDGTNTTGQGEASPDVFNSLLFGASSLSRSSHTVVLRNEGSGSNNWLDLDYVHFQDNPTSSTGLSTPQTLFAANNDSAFNYLPSDSIWPSLPSNASLSGVLCRTQASDGELQIGFTGSSIALYGRVGPSNSFYTCQVDGGDKTAHTGYSAQYANEQVLCFANNLAPAKQHTLKVVNNPAVSGQVWLEVDYVQVWGSTVNIGTTASTSKLALVAAVIGAVTLLLLIGLSIGLFFFFRRRKKKRQDRRASYAQVRLDEGDDWHPLGTYAPRNGGAEQSGVLSTNGSAAHHFPGDALGVYAGLTRNAEPSSTAFPDSPTRDALRRASAEPIRSPQRYSARDDRASDTVESPGMSIAPRPYTLHIDDPQDLEIISSALAPSGSSSAGHNRTPSQSSSSPFHDQNSPSLHNPFSASPSASRFSPPIIIPSPQRREEDAGLLMTDEDDAVRIDRDDEGPLPPDYDDVPNRRSAALALSERREKAQYLPSPGLPSTETHGASTSSTADVGTSATSTSNHSTTTSSPTRYMYSTPYESQT
ncbi:hypothetical protein DL93DRAFT_2078580 [Clavulina sp. PMI_390]|nr:hypothetical protein DL93DRAFT_2078580 [Clavulina sp. PMI_390]